MAGGGLEIVNWKDSPPFGRRKTLIGTLNLLAARRTEPQIIVEVGTSEAYSPDGLGNAMLAFGWYAKQFDSIIHAVDVREGAIQNSAAILREYCFDTTRYVRFHRLDAFEYAAFVNNPEHDFYLPRIDLIYYDAPSEPWSWYVELYERWKGKFQTGALALFDDTEPRMPFAGKGGALIPKLLNEGWRQVPVDCEPVFPMVLLEKP